MISLPGRLYRCHMTLATPIETEAAAFLEKHPAPSGWTPGVRADTIATSPGRNS